MAKQLAREVGYVYIDTGAMYRAVTLFALRRGLFRSDGGLDAARLEALMPEVHVSFRLDAGTGLPQTLLNGENVEAEIRGMEVSSHVSPVAALPFVRAALTLQQQEMGRGKGIVMDGRDIGTVVFPDAELKVFVTASDEVRARRRCDELAAKGQPADFGLTSRGRSPAPDPRCPRSRQQPADPRGAAGLAERTVCRAGGRRLRRGTLRQAEARPGHGICCP